MHLLLIGAVSNAIVSVNDFLLCLEYELGIHVEGSVVFVMLHIPLPSTVS